MRDVFRKWRRTTQPVMNITGVRVNTTPAQVAHSLRERRAHSSANTAQSPKCLGRRFLTKARANTLMIYFFLRNPNGERAWPPNAQRRDDSEKNNQRSAPSRTRTFLPANKVSIERLWGAGGNTEERMYVRAGKGHQSLECLRRTHIPFIFL